MSDWRFPKLFCHHQRVRCTHGDEIISHNFRRRVCLDCNKALKGPLPEPCSVTGRPHHHAEVEA